jgi:hypothetical protein
MEVLIHNLEGVLPGGRNAALNHTAWTLGRWVAEGALDQHEVEDALYATAGHNGLVADDGQRQCWATIRSGLGGTAALLDLEATHGSRRAKQPAGDGTGQVAHRQPPPTGWECAWLSSLCRYRSPRGVAMT